MSNWHRAVNKSRNGKTTRGLSPCRIVDDNGNVIAFAVPQKSRKEQIANTNLIARAKEMYQMLNKVVEFQERNYGNGVKTHLNFIELVEDIKMVLKKARGEQC